VDATKRLKVLHLIDSAGFYGAERVLLHLMAEHCRLGVRSILGSCCRRGEETKAIERRALSKGLEVERFQLRWGLDLAGGLDIVKYARRNECTVIHSHGYKPNAILGMLPGSLRGIPIVATVHGWTSTNRFSKIAAYEWLDRRVLSRFDRVVVVNDAPAVKRLLSGVKRSRLKVVYNGVPEVEDNQEARPDDGFIQRFLENDSFVLGSIGRLSPEKGQRFLLSAVEQLVRGGHDVRLVVFGEGPERDALGKQVERLRLQERVLLPGYCAHATEYLPRLNAFVLPSLTEGMPLTLLEAMRAGIPVIASRVGGIPQMIENGKSGLITEPGRADELAEAVEKLIRNQVLRASLASEARGRALTIFSSRAMALQYKRIYEETRDCYPELD